MAIEEERFEVWMEEYRGLTADISNRVDLQHKNVNLSLILLSAFSGYLFDYWNSHTFDEVKRGEIASLIVLAPLLALFFVWRHLDHDSNIIEKAEYIQRIVRPQLVGITGDSDVLGFEGYLRRSRLRRIYHMGPLWVLGNEHLIPLSYISAYFAFAWYLRLGVDGRAGEAKHLFDYALYLGSGLLIVSMLMSVTITVRYSRIGDPTRQLGGAPLATLPIASGQAVVGPVSTVSLPIKANSQFGLYYVPGGRYYDGARADLNFATEVEAEAAGFRPAEP